MEQHCVFEVGEAAWGPNCGRLVASLPEWCGV